MWREYDSLFGRSFRILVILNGPYCKAARTDAAHLCVYRIRPVSQSQTLSKAPRILILQSNSAQ